MKNIFALPQNIYFTKENTYADFDDKELMVYEYTQPDYEPTMHFHTWPVAIANYADRFDPDKFEKIERHMLTDEVFVLLLGKAWLVIGKELRKIEMEPGKIYNVKAGAWHNVLLEKDSKVLIVENHNTSSENSELCSIK